MNTARYVLGTAQLGMPYGISNLSGRPDSEEALAVVRTALDSGITWFDTAQAYGHSEKTLGDCFRRLGVCGRVKVVTKVAPSLDGRNAGDLDEVLGLSLKALGVDRLAGLMLHHERQMDDLPHGLSAWLARQKREGLTEAVGVSVYSPLRARAALALEDVDLIQVPANVLDRRMEEAGILAGASKMIHVRSVFLQGLLLMAPEALVPAMDFARPVLEPWRAFAARCGMSPRELALGYALAKWPSALVVIGSEKAAQVAENAGVRELDRTSEVFRALDERFSCPDERIILPGNWPKFVLKEG